MVDKEHTGPDDQALKKLAVDLIEEQSTMTLATAKGDVAWSAPVYYVFFKSCFYFFSDPTSRHIQESLASGQASCSIYANASSWQEIRGIQMSGHMETVAPRVEESLPEELTSESRNWQTDPQTMFHRTR